MAGRTILVAVLLTAGTLGVALAAGDRHGGHGRGGPHGHMSIERVAMHNILTELVSARTGKSAGEVRAAFEAADHPHDAIEDLGLSREEMRPLFQQAHEQLLAKAAKAGLITSDQAAKIRAQMKEHRERMEERREERRERRDPSDRDCLWPGRGAAYVT